MLFDLRGHRRRAVQATYLTLAVLMGGGLVLFGIGGSSGGIVDAITGNSGGGGGNVNEQLEKRIERQQERLKANPANAAVLASLVRLEYQAATSQQASGSTTFSADAKENLRAAARYWDRYVEANGGEPSADLSQLAVILFGQTALNDPKRAVVAVRAIAADRNDSQAYLLLVQTATAAGDTRTAQLAAQKAIDLAPKGQEKQVEKLTKQLQKSGASLQPDASTTP
jgi:hypothetical protein